MSTECSSESYDFGRVEGRRLVADFGGGTLTSNGGALLLRQVAKATGLVTRLAGCFTDHRAEDRVEYGVPTLLGQRLFGLALGSEDLNDHDELRHDPLLAAKLRPANIDGAAGAILEVERIVAQIRDTWPSVRIILRADSGFARDALMTWAEDNKVDYLFGLAKTKRLITKIRPELDQARADRDKTGAAARVFADFTWSTLKSWSAKRRVVGKAEILPPATEIPHDPKKPNLGKANPRFVVTSINAEEHDAQTLYEKLYCARGDMENRIKDKQLDLFGTRTSAASMRANQLRLWLSGFAYILIKALQRIALVGTTLKNASPQRIRLSLLKIAAQITLSARRMRAAMTSACPHKTEFTTAYQRLAELTAF